ncbi:MAG: hypothetical protein [Sanya fiers-like virus 31]|nr:MAG: hypothetical protein [Sanya fiers-like virus 31]
MPSLANITVKKNDGTTDIVYTGIAASAGDGSPAVWRCTTIGSAAAQRPELRVTSRNNGSKTGRRVEGSYTYPETVTGTDGIVRVSERFNLTFSAIVPQGMTDTGVNEAVAQSLNLLASALIKSSVQSGFAPT